MRKLTKTLEGMVDLGVVLTIGIAFVGLVVLSLVLYKVKGSLWPREPGNLSGAGTDWTTQAYNRSYFSGANVTNNWDSSVSLILVAITISILGLAVGSLIYLRGKQN